MAESSPTKAGSEPDKFNRTIVHEILDSNLPQAEKTVERVSDETAPLQELRSKQPPRPPA